MGLPFRSAFALGIAATLAACAGMTACDHAAAPSASQPASRSSGIHADAARLGPPAGDQAEAHALATKLLSLVRLPAGALRLPATRLPLSVPGPSLWGGAAASLDVHELFEIPAPLTTATAELAAHFPAGTSPTGSGVARWRAGFKKPWVAYGEVGYADRFVPAGVNAAQLVITLGADSSGGSLARVDAQVIWYPPRTAAEYVDSGRYHVLTVTVTVFGTRPRIVSKVITSRSAITRLADALNRSHVEPLVFVGCPPGFATYRLAFAVARHTAPAAVVATDESRCLGAQITVDGRKQPPLQDAASVVAIANQLLGYTPRP